VAVSQVNSARVPSILEVGTVSTPIGDCFWFRERRISGKTVRELLALGPLSIPDLLRLGLHTLESLLAAEQAKIVHRDVKPENIIRDTSGSFWLIDFGIARHLDLDSITATVSAFGKSTLGYAPQEQYRNVKTEIDARCDLFALGVTLYECATGHNPFDDGARDAMEQLTRVETMPLPGLTLTFASAEKFADLVAALTQKRRDHRPSSVREAYDWMRKYATPKESKHVDLYLHVGMVTAYIHRRWQIRSGNRRMELYLQFGYGMMEHCRFLVSEWQGGTVVLSPRDLTDEQLGRLA
jgi:serine/threonine protein kinase